MLSKKNILFFILIVITIGFLSFKSFISPAKIQYEGINQDLALKEKVDVFFDDFGVPHIFAENDSDLFTVAGYLGARDRLYQMTFLKYAYKGQISEVINDTLFSNDKFIRTIGFQNVALESEKKISPEIRNYLQWTCDGINSYINSLSPSEYPLEFKLLGIKEIPLFEPIDIVALSTMMAWELEGGWDSELFFGAIHEKLGEEYLKDILPEYDPSFITIATNDMLLETFQSFSNDSKSLRKLLNTDREGYGSNVWVLSGEKTESGMPLLTNDPHLAYNQPPWWYEIRLKSPSFNFGGYGLYGFPLPVLGHNESIAWGFTNVMTDDMDFYIETINEDSTKYFLDEEWVDLKIRKETVQLKSGEIRQFDVRSTHRGPIISEIHKDAKKLNKAISFRWTEYDAFDETTALFKLGQAENWEEFSQASKLFGAPGQNWTYADVQGNIGWRPSSKIPIRNGGEKLLPFDGSTSKNDWKGYIPFEEMPYLFNPEKGYISNGNNKTIDDSYPYYISRYWADPSRAQQIDSRINSKDKLNVEDMKSMLNDIHSPFGEEYAKIFVEYYSVGSSKEGDQIYNLISEWDGSESKNSSATVAFHSVYLSTLKNLFQDELSQFGNTSFDTFYSLKYLRSIALRKMFRDGNSKWIDNVSTSKKESLNDIMNQSFYDAYLFIKNNFGEPSKIVWGDVHQVSFKHRLDKDPLVEKLIKFSVGPLPMSGSGFTPQAASYSVEKPFEVRAGSSMRRIIDLSNLDNGFSILPTGQSGVFGSKHYDDQAELYNQGLFKNFKFSEEAIRSDANMKKLLFKPAD